MTLALVWEWFIRIILTATFVIATGMVIMLFGLMLALVWEEHRNK